MFSFLFSLAMATTVYVPMTTKLETTVAHHFVNKNFHSKKKDMIVVSWIGCQSPSDREGAMVKGFWYLDIKQFDDGDSLQINLFLYNEKNQIVSEAIIQKRYRIDKIPQKTIIKGTEVQGGTITPTKTEIENPPLLVRRKPEITGQDISQAVIRLLTRIEK